MSVLPDSLRARQAELLAQLDTAFTQLRAVESRVTEAETAVWRDHSALFALVFGGHAASTRESLQSENWTAGSARNATRLRVEQLVLAPFLRQLQKKVQFAPYGAVRNELLDEILALGNVEGQEPLYMSDPTGDGKSSRLFEILFRRQLDACGLKRAEAEDQRLQKQIKEQIKKEDKKPGKSLMTLGLFKSESKEVQALKSEQTLSWKALEVEQQSFSVFLSRFRAFAERECLDNELVVQMEESVLPIVCRALADWHVFKVDGDLARLGQWWRKFQDFMQTEGGWIGLVEDDTGSGLFVRGIEKSIKTLQMRKHAYLELANFGDQQVVPTKGFKVRTFEPELTMKLVSKITTELRRVVAQCLESTVPSLELAASKLLTQTAAQVHVPGAWTAVTDAEACRYARQEILNQRQTSDSETDSPMMDRESAICEVMTRIERVQGILSDVLERAKMSDLDEITSPSRRRRQDAGASRDDGSYRKPFARPFVVARVTEAVSFWSSYSERLIELLDEGYSSSSAAKKEEPEDTAALEFCQDVLALAGFSGCRKTKAEENDREAETFWGSLTAAEGSCEWLKALIACLENLDDTEKPDKEIDSVKRNARTAFLKQAKAGIAALRFRGVRRELVRPLLDYCKFVDHVFVAGRTSTISAAEDCALLFLEHEGPMRRKNESSSFELKRGGLDVEPAKKCSPRLRSPGRDNTARRADSKRLVGLIPRLETEPIEDTFIFSGVIAETAPVVYAGPLDMAREERGNSKGSNDFSEPAKGSNDSSEQTLNAPLGPKGARGTSLRASSYALKDPGTQKVHYISQRPESARKKLPPLPLGQLSPKPY